MKRVQDTIRRRRQIHDDATRPLEYVLFDGLSIGPGGFSVNDLKAIAARIRGLRIFTLIFAQTQQMEDQQRDWFKST